MAGPPAIDADDIGQVAYGLAVLGRYRPDLADRVRAEWRARLPGVTLARLERPIDVARAALLTIAALCDAVADRGLEPDPDPDRYPTDGTAPAEVYRYDPDDAGRPFGHGPGS